MGWTEKYKVVPGIGIYDDIHFEPATWNNGNNGQYSRYQWSALARNRILEKVYAPPSYPGSVVNPGSGPTIPYSDLASWSSDQYNPTVLYAIQYGSDEVALKCMVVKAVITNRNYQSSVGRGNITFSDVNFRIFKRTYPDKTDLTTFTETPVNGSAGALNYFQPVAVAQNGTNATGCTFTLEYFYDAGQLYVGGFCTFFAFKTDNTQWSASKTSSCLCPDMTQFKNLFNNDEPYGEMSSDEFGTPSQPGGGYNDDSAHKGSFDDSSDTIRLQPKPSIGVTSIGFINVYKITPGQLQDLGKKIFPNITSMVFGVSNPTIQDVLMVLAQIMMGGALTGGALPIAQAEIGLIDILVNGKLIDYIVDCHIIPTSVSGASVEGLKVGYRQFNEIQVARANEDYVDVDCGSLSIPEYWANFLDFQTQTELYLPFVGYVPIDCELYIGGSLNIMYRVNIVDGSFVCCVYATSGKSNLSQSLIGHYMGVCCVHFPITGMQYSNVVSGLIASTASIGAGAATGNTGGVVSGALNLLKMQPERPMSNGYNASGNFLAKRKPYLVIKRPVAQFSMNYNKEMGLPLNVTKKLSEVHGFTVIDNPRLTLSCTDAEYNEIVSLLKNGVIL